LGDREGIYPIKYPAPIIPKISFPVEHTCTKSQNQCISIISYWELLHADDLILMAESEVELSEMIVNWKAGMKVKGLKMNSGKTKGFLLLYHRQGRGAG